MPCNLYKFSNGLLRIFLYIYIFYIFIKDDFKFKLFG